ncbi:hypothetical protein PG984_003397 [Apiospora sp. TS-2023a]
MCSSHDDAFANVLLHVGALAEVEERVILGIGVVDDAAVQDRLLGPLVPPPPRIHIEALEVAAGELVHGRRHVADAQGGPLEGPVRDRLEQALVVRDMVDQRPLELAPQHRPHQREVVDDLLGLGDVSDERLVVDSAS